MNIKCKHAALVFSVVAILNNLGKKTYRDGDMGFGDPQPLERYLEYPEDYMRILVWCAEVNVNRADLYIDSWEDVRKELVEAYKECYADIGEIASIVAEVAELCEEGKQYGSLYMV